MIKIQFLPDVTSDGAIENMFALPVDGGFRLENSPFHAVGVSFQDVVSARNENGAWIFTGVTQPGGHSTYRILVRNDAQREEFAVRWPALQALGCSYEHSSLDDRHLYAVDVPPGVDVNAAFALMEEGEDDGAWTFEEAHYGGPPL